MAAEAPFDLPLLVEPQPGEPASLAALIGKVERERGRLSADLLRTGALVLRGFDVEGIDGFGEVVAALSQKSRFLPYSGGASPRDELGSSRAVYSSTEYPADATLPLHNELSYVETYPERVYFFCLVPPDYGGATTLGDSRRILARMDDQVVDEFTRKGVAYIRNLSPDAGSGYSWQDAFRSDDPQFVERRCAEMGASCEWLEKGYLRVSQVRPATAVHPVTGEEVWFNQADGFHPSVLDDATYAEMLAFHGSEERFRLNVSYGDGSPIERETLDHVRAVMREETVPHRWQKGDVMVLDNMLAAHGRAPFEGKRKIAVAMT